MTELKTAREESKALIEKLYELYTVYDVPINEIAVGCKTCTGSLYRWFADYKKGNVKRIQQSIRYFMKEFIKKYYTNSSL